MTPHPYGWLSLLPPLVAIVLAIATRRIVLSLVAGIFAGALMMANGNVVLAIYHTWETHLWNTLVDAGKLRVFSFTLLMGAMVGVIARSGGMQGLIQLLTPWARNRRRGQLVTWLMGLVIFFDDYANTMLLGSTLRPVCDRLKISREKLAYLVDSTAAPVAGIVPLSTWVAVEIDYINNGLQTISADGFSAFGLFLSSIPYRFYVLSALFLVPLTALLGRDIGPMVEAERRALQNDVDVSNGDVVGSVAVADVRAAWPNAVLPIALTLGLVVYFIYATGSNGACASAATSAIANAEQLVADNSVTNNDADEDLATSSAASKLEAAISDVRTAADARDVRGTDMAIQSLSRVVGTMTNTPDVQLASQFQTKLKLRDVLGAADSSMALQYGSLAGLILAIIMPAVSRNVPVDELLRGAADGAKIVLPAVAILWTASAMSRMTTDTSYAGETSEAAFQFKDHRLYTASYLTNVFTGNRNFEQDQATDAASNVSPDVPATTFSSSRFGVQYLPTIVFILAGIVAFCTGTSWGTMGILVPMVVQTAYAMLARDGQNVSPDDPILLCSIGGVLAGAVFGDHCSPISDTTVLSSQSSGCDHLAHVWTQMPYALLVASVSVLLGTLPLGFGVSIWILLPLQFLALFVVLRVFGRRIEAD